MQLEGPTAAGLMYSNTGSDRPAVLLPHGVLINGTLWDTAVASLGGRYRCTVPEPELLLKWDDQQRTFAGPVLMIRARQGTHALPRPNHTRATSRTPDWYGSTTVTPSSPSTNRRI